MNRKKLYLILMLMAISLAGITVMQVIWLRNAIKVNEENFNRAVNESLSSVVEKLTLEKSLYFAWQKNNLLRENQPKKLVKKDYKQRVKTFVKTADDSAKKVKQVYSVKVDNGGINYSYTQRINIDSLTSNIQEEIKKENIFIDNDLFRENDIFLSNEFFDSAKNNIEHKIIRIPTAKSATWSFTDSEKQSIYVVSSDSSSFVISISDSDLPVYIKESIDSLKTKVNYVLHDDLQVFPDLVDGKFLESPIEAKTEVFNDEDDIKSDAVIQVAANDLAKREEQHTQAIDQLVFEMDAKKMKLEERIDPIGVGALLKSELGNRGFNSPFEYALISNDSTRRVAYATPNFNNGNNLQPYRTNLFPKNIIPLNDYLEVTFPDKNYTIYKSVLLPVSASGFFTLIILLTFTITLVTIIKQKKLAEMKADFINNMTHELKTPIATINLATDSIENPKVVEKPDTVKYFTSIIREENIRMNKLVESVLQTARLEKKTLKLNITEVDIIDLINRVAKQISVQVTDKSGILHLDLPESPVIINADEHLIENVIFNLVDNALKYCDKTPFIIITLKKLPGGISISVEDNGIGISRSDQNKVFEKFFRVSQGDVHNVKGFGLGLSNVKEITELHGGMVQLRSEVGKGSTFTLYFPFKTNGDE